MFIALPLKQRRHVPTEIMTAALDTSNGTEAQNKVLKYKYMPKHRASTLSALVSLLVERFLPEAQQSYVLPNLKAAEWYRRYNDFVKRFLRCRSRSVILHCLDQQSRSNKYHDKDLMDGESIHYTEERQGTVHGRLWQKLTGTDAILFL